MEEDIDEGGYTRMRGKFAYPSGRDDSPVGGI